VIKPGSAPAAVSRSDEAKINPSSSPSSEGVASANSCTSKELNLITRRPEAKYALGLFYYQITVKNTANIAVLSKI
jgi:hypothetical protein